MGDMAATDILRTTQQCVPCLACSVNHRQSQEKVQIINSHPSASIRSYHTKLENGRASLTNSFQLIMTG